MTPYWLLFFMPVLALLSPCCQVKSSMYGLIGTMAILMIGLRYQVGGDWDTYLGYVVAAEKATLSGAINMNDPLYMFVNWVSANMGLGIVGVNLVCGFLLIFGLQRLCRQLPFPLIGWVVATPVLIIIVGMGYSRQAAAIGIVLSALAGWRERAFFKYVGLILIAGLFHKTAVVMLLFAPFMNRGRLLAKIFFISLLILFFYMTIKSQALSEAGDAYLSGADFHSAGGLPRVLMNSAAAIIFLLFYRRFSILPDRDLWLLFAACSFFSLCSVMFFSTLTDRFSLYLLPLQIVVYATVPIMIKDKFLRLVFVGCVVVSYSLVLFVWLNYGMHSKEWLPYRWAFISE